MRFARRRTANDAVDRQQIEQPHERFGPLDEVGDALGLKRMDQILGAMCEGKGKAGDIDTLRDIAETMKVAALCDLGRTAANPALTTFRYFMDEYEAHVKKRCPAGVCSALVTYRIHKRKCTGCGLCTRVCPTECIAGAKKKVHVIDTKKCIKCGQCYDVCKFDAVIRK